MSAPPSNVRNHPMLRLPFAAFSLFVLALLLAASWLRSLVPAPRPAVRVRDVSWPSGPAR